MQQRGIHGSAALFATNRVLRSARGKIVTAVRKEVGVSARSIRKRVLPFRATFRKPRAKIWAGLRRGVPLYEAGGINKGVRKHAPTDQAFEATMPSGHRGLFYRSYRGGTPRRQRVPGRRSDTPIYEVRADIRPAINEHMVPIARRAWSNFDAIYIRDVSRRLQRRGWKS